ITDQEFPTQRTLVADQRSAVARKDTHQTVDAAEIRKHFHEISLPLVHRRSTWDAMPIQYRRRFERLVLPAGVVIGQVRPGELGGLFSFFRGLVQADSSVVPHACVRSNRIIPEIQGSGAY